jgi:lipid A 3-O-deacylase
VRWRHGVRNDGLIIRLGLAWVVSLFLGQGFDARADIGGPDGFFSITDEDDAYAYPWLPHTDRYYTHGVKLSYMGSYETATNAPQFPGKILGWGTRPEAGSVGGVFGQNMYTPENILDPAPIPTDRPYAGWLYAGLVYQRRGELASNLSVMDSFEADVGMVGPDSLAGATQKSFHRIFFPDDIPAGWHNQIRNEPGVILKYERLWRYSPTAGTARYFDVIPRAGFDLGNIFTFATAGVTGRLGFDLPRDFGEATIDSPGAVNSGLTGQPDYVSVYVFGGVDGRAVAQNITLDGSWFQSDPHVSKNTWVADLSYGLSIQVNPHCRFLLPFEVSYTHIERTREFHGQNGDDIFGSLTVKCYLSFP